jgi:hypothetical protein
MSASARAMELIAWHAVAQRDGADPHLGGQMAAEFAAEVGANRLIGALASLGGTAVRLNASIRGVEPEVGIDELREVETMYRLGREIEGEDFPDSAPED